MSDSTPTQANPLAAAGRAGVETWLRTLDCGRAWNRAATTGLCSSLELGATATEATAALTRAGPYAGLDSADAVAAPTADAMRDLATEVSGAAETVETLTRFQQHLLAVTAAGLFGASERLETGTETEGEPITIDVSEG